jgi:hypothetical protein
MTFKHVTKVSFDIGNGVEEKRLMLYAYKIMKHDFGIVMHDVLLTN